MKTALICTFYGNEWASGDHVVLYGRNAIPLPPDEIEYMGVRHILDIASTEDGPTTADSAEAVYIAADYKS